MSSAGHPSDWAERGPGDPVDPPVSIVGWRRVPVLATVFLVGAMAVAAFFHNEFRAQNWDPMQTRVYVERAMRYGGTFYENGLVNKGPFEPAVYRVAALLTSRDGFWYAISLFVLIAAAVAAWAASATARRLGAHRWLGIGVGILVFYHFALGKADYAGVLYSRNMIITLFAGAWMIGLSARWWTPSRALGASIAAGVLVGIGVQTLFVSTVAALGVLTPAWIAASDLGADALRRRCRRALVITPIAVFLTAPAYYLVRGRFAEFWGSYWTYNGYQNAATGRSLANQLVYARDVILRYYRAWPVSLVIVLAFVGITIALWATLGRRQRVIHVGIAVWFLGAWAELVAGQRYSSHYYSILAMPTALMAAAVIAQVYRLVRRDRAPFASAAVWPLAASLLAVVIGGGQHLTLGLQAASEYSSVHATADARREAEPGRQRTTRAVMDLVSDAGDPLLAWTEYPWTYLNYQRVSATRWIWKSFMLGQIYLGRASPNYVLPHTWEWFADDMREADPLVALEEVAMPITAGTPFATYVENNFEVVQRGTDTIIHLRNEAAEEVLRGDRGDDFTPSTIGATSWTVDDAGASREAGEALDPADLLSLSTSRCTRISGDYTLAADGAFVSFLFADPTGKAANMRINVVGPQVFSGSDTAVFDSTLLDDAGPDVPDDGVSEPVGSVDPVTRDFALVVGDRSAALVVDGLVRAAVRLTTQTSIGVEVRQGGVAFSGLARGDAPTGSGCEPR